ncbi:MAG: FtsH protease activity modulator HflK [Alphaproteobacteria bacterium]
MPWSNNSGGPWGGGGGNDNRGGGGGGQNPWGRGSGGGGGPNPPDVEKMVREGQEKLKKLLPKGFGGKGIALVGFLVVGLWLATGFYQVDSNEQGVTLVFGKYWDKTDPGLHWNFPAPIGEVLLPRVTEVNQEQIGFEAAGSITRSTVARAVPEESLMLTGDENIIDIQAVVFWQIAEAEKFLFNVRNPQQTVRNASEAAIREIVGKVEFEFARTQGRGEVAGEIQLLAQSILDEYEAGIAVTNVQLQKVDPPDQVIDAFRDVQAANADKERAINEATAYRNVVTQGAEGQAQQIIRAAEAYKEERIAQATGDSQRFLSVYEEYAKAKDITKRRIYLQTMEEIMSTMEKVLIEDGNGGSGVLPYLPLDKLTEGRAKSGAAQ